VFTRVEILNLEAGNRDTRAVGIGPGPVECAAFSTATAIAPRLFAALRENFPVFRPTRQGAHLAIFYESARGVVMSTMVGMGQRLNVLSDDDEQPVYLLTRRRGATVQGPELIARAPLASDVSAERAPLRSDVRELVEERAPLRSDVRELSPGRSTAGRQERSASDASWRYAPLAAAIDEGWDDLDDDEASSIRSISSAGRRQRAIRVLGALAIVGSLAGGTFVLQQPKVRREALSFVTMGHEEGAARLGRKIASIYHDLRR
jgi:hypothetical protein